MIKLTRMVLRFLNSFYVPEGVFLREIVEYSADHRMLSASFCVPKGQSYVQAGINIDYVTTEQFIRCVSQISCSLLSLLRMGSVKGFDFIRREHFEKVWYRNTTLDYKKHIAKGDNFVVKAIILDVYTMRHFWVTHIRISGAVQGTIELVLRKGTK